MKIGIACDHRGYHVKEMIKREFRVNFKSFLIWLLILIIMFLVVYSIYPYIITDETMKSMDELMKVFPKEVLKAFNMDMSSIETASIFMLPDT